MKGVIKYVLIALIAFPFSAYAKSQHSALDIFSHMKALVGVWIKEDDENSNLKISFELTANNTTLIETWIYQGKKHSLTLYHLNGDKLMATHYCPQGNQPRLQLSSSSTLSHLSFSYFDATNLKSIDDSHQHSLSFDLSVMESKIVRGETYLNGSGESYSELILVRD